MSRAFREPCAFVTDATYTGSVVYTEFPGSESSLFFTVK